jgi:hypothetical protein
LHKARFTLALVGLAATASALPALSPTSRADDLAEDLVRRRADRTLSVDPTDGRAGRLSTPGTSAVTPFTVTPNGANTGFTTSLSQWSSSLSAADRDELKAASDASGANLPLPQKVKPSAPKLDVWAQGRREAFGQTGGTEAGNALTSFMGADYRVDHDLLVGGMVQVDEARREAYAASHTADGTAYMAGPYVAYRLTPHLQLDATAAWGLGQDSAIADGENTAYTTERTLSEAKITGNWGWRGWQLSQTGALTYLGETSNELGGVPGASVDIARLSTGPEVKRRFEIGDDAVVEPFAFFKSSLDMEGVGLSDPNAVNTLGGGLNLSEEDTYSVKATADYSESTDSADPGVAQGKYRSACRPQSSASSTMPS